MEDNGLIEGADETVTLRLDEDYHEAISFHRWFAMRGTTTARAAVAFTASPEWLSDPGKVALVAAGDDAAIANAVAQLGSVRGQPAITSDKTEAAKHLLDLCSGIGTVAALAARLGFDALSVELSTTPYLINRVLHDFAVTMAAGAGGDAGSDESNTGSWRGFVIEVEEFASAVWRGAKSQLGELFEDDIDIRLWIRVVQCSSCGNQVPLLSNVRLSQDTALNVSPGPKIAGENGFAQFGLLRTDFPDLKGTFARGICTCPTCRHQFRFSGYDLLSLRAVPVAVRMRDSGTLQQVDSPGEYIAKVSADSYSEISASSQRLRRPILPDGQPIFYDAHDVPVTVNAALLPRQRAYFVALAESMDRESGRLAKRTQLTADHRFALRSAVALLISSQVDYVNTAYMPGFIDKLHPSTSMGPLRLSGLFTEAGGHRLERLWQSRLRHLLDLLRENSSASRPVRVIQADAAATGLDDSSVSAVVWDPPYYDNVDYDTVGEHYHVILSAMIPDLVLKLQIPPRLPPPEGTERYELDLLQQANEARRVISPNGRIGVFWLAKRMADLNRFLDIVRPAGLQVLGIARLDTIRKVRQAAGSDPKTYLLILQPTQTAAPAVAIDTEKAFALATVGALSLYDGLAKLLESVCDPAELDGLIPEEYHGPSQQRLAEFLASHPELEQLLVEQLGRVTLVRELVSRGARVDDLRAMKTRALAQQLLSELGFAVARPALFSIREALRDWEKIKSQLDLADSSEAVRGSFVEGCTRIERVLRYASFAWSHLVFGSRWNEPLEEIIRASNPKRLYRGPEKLAFGEYELLFVRLPVTFAERGSPAERAHFAKLVRAMKQARMHEKLSALVSMRNDVSHDDGATASLSLPQLRQRSSSALADAYMALDNLDNRQLLPLTVRPEEERRDRYGRRVLRLLDPDGVAIEAYVGSETDLTEPLIYFASGIGRRDVNPRFLRAAIVEGLLGLT